MANITRHNRFWIVGSSLALIALAYAALSFFGPTQPDNAALSPRKTPLDAGVTIRENDVSLPTLTAASTIGDDSPIAAEYAALDPASDGWASESIHERIKGQMKFLAKRLEHPEQWDVGEFTELTADTFSCSSLRPNELVTAFDSGAFSVVRQSATASGDNRIHRGAEGLTAALRELLQPLRDAKRLRFDVKIFHVELEGNTATSRAYVVLSGHGSARSIQQNATWDCRWSIAEQAAPPRLESVIVRDFEQVTLRTNGESPFLDCTRAVLGGNSCFSEQLLPGTDHWTSRIEQRLGMYIDGWSGLAVGDVNGDHLDDLYVCQPGGLPNRLFLQNLDGTATDVSSSHGVDWLDRSTAALLVDLNNDGQQDLAVAIQGGVLVMQNNGHGRFHLRQTIPTGGQPYSLAAADFDNDARLDLYVCCYNDGQRAVQQGGLGVPVPYYDAHNGAANVLLRNQGRFSFVNVTANVGMDQNNRRFSYAAAWEDFDNDGDQDLYVANDFGRNNLYRNDGGQFRDVAAEVGVEDVGSGMSVSWSDYNNDGWMDAYVGNMFSAAGSRITHQRQFNPSLTAEALFSLRRLARGNTLFANAGDGTMRDVSFEAGVTMGRWAWSSNFIDINNDGRDDLVVANGFVTGTSDDDL